NVLVNTGQFSTLQRWMSSVPLTWRDRQPMLGLGDAALMLASGAVESSIDRMDEIERRLETFPPERAHLQLARVAAVRCYISCFQNDLDGAETYAEQALRTLEPDDIRYRAQIFHALGDTYRR